MEELIEYKFSEADTEYCRGWESIMQDAFKSTTLQLEKIIKDKLTEKGMGNLLEGIGSRRFSKLLSIKMDGWTYIFADNDTDEGLFIVAIRQQSKAGIFDPKKGYDMKTYFEIKDTYNGEVDKRLKSNNNE